MEQQGDPLSEDKTEKLGDFMRRVKDDTVLNLYFVTETGSKRIPTPLFGNPTAEQLRDNRYLQSQVVASRKHYCNEVISSGWPRGYQVRSGGFRECLKWIEAGESADVGSAFSAPGACLKP